MISRRDVLRGLGASTLALPFARRAFAAGETPLRLILWPMMNGSVSEDFFPKSLGSMSVITEPLAPFADSLTFIRGLNISGSHDHYAVRSIYSGAPVTTYTEADPRVRSLDQVVANALLASPGATKLKSLHLGAIPADNLSLYKRLGRSTLFFDSSGALDYEANPVTAFDRVFGGMITPSGPPIGAGLEAEFANAVLDLTDAELADVAAKVRTSPTEAGKIEMHQEAMKNLRVDPTGEPVQNDRCSMGAIASVEKLRPSIQGSASAAYRYSLFSDLFDAQIDILARAVTCGLTRVATLQAASADGPQTIPIGPGYAHHPTSHGGAATWAQCQRWYSGKLARLLSALNVPDPLDATGKTVLDNSLVLVMAECVPNGHGSNNVPCLIAGKAGGLIKSGAMLNVNGATNKMLLKAVASKVFKVADSESPHFGNTHLTEVLA